MYNQLALRTPELEGIMAESQISAAVYMHELEDIMAMWEKTQEELRELKQDRKARRVELKTIQAELAIELEGIMTMWEKSQAELRGLKQDRKARRAERKAMKEEIALLRKQTAKDALRIAELSTEPSCEMMLREQVDHLAHVVEEKESELAHVTKQLECLQLQHQPVRGMMIGEVEPPTRRTSDFADVQDLAAVRNEQPTSTCRVLALERRPDTEAAAAEEEDEGLHRDEEDLEQNAASWERAATTLAPCEQPSALVLESLQERQHGTETAAAESAQLEKVRDEGLHREGEDLELQSAAPILELCEQPSALLLRRTVAATPTRSTAATQNSAIMPRIAITRCRSSSIDKVSPTSVIDVLQKSTIVATLPKDAASGAYGRRRRTDVETPMWCCFSAPKKSNPSAPKASKREAAAGATVAIGSFSQTREPEPVTPAAAPAAAPVHEAEPVAAAAASEVEPEPVALAAAMAPVAAPDTQPESSNVNADLSAESVSDAAEVSDEIEAEDEALQRAVDKPTSTQELVEGAAEEDDAVAEEEEEEEEEEEQEEEDSAAVEKDSVLGRGRLQLQRKPVQVMVIGEVETASEQSATRECTFAAGVEMPMHAWLRTNSSGSASVSTTAASSSSTSSTGSSSNDNSFRRLGSRVAQTSLSVTVTVTATDFIITTKADAADRWSVQFPRPSAKDVWTSAKRAWIRVPVTGSETAMKAISLFLDDPVVAAGHLARSPD